MTKRTGGRRDMKKIMDLIAEELTAAFEKAGYDAKFAKVTLSNRPDLCEYQCNGAMAAAKAYKKAPIMIAQDVLAALGESRILGDVQAVNPGLPCRISDRDAEG